MKRQGLVTTIRELRSLCNEMEKEKEESYVPLERIWDSKFQINIVNRRGLSDTWEIEKPSQKTGDSKTLFPKSKKDKTTYGCGHKGEPVVLDDNEVSAVAYFEWKESAGFEGDKSKCFKCWCKESTVSTGRKGK